MKVSTFIRQVTRPYRCYLYSLMLVMVFMAIDTSLRPYLIKLLIDSVISKSPQSHFLSVGVIASFYVGLSFIFSMSWRLVDWISLKYEPALRNHIASNMSAYVREHSHQFFQDNFAGSIGSKIFDAAAHIPEIIATMIYRYFTEVLVLIIAFYALWHIHVWFALALLCWSTLFTTIVVLFIHRFNYLANDTAEAGSRIMGHIIDFLGNMSSVRLFVGRKVESARLDEVQAQYLASSQKRRWFLLKIYTFQGVSFVAYQAVCLALLIYLYGQQKVTPGDFVMILTLNMGIITSLWETANEMRTFSENLGSVDQALKIIYVPHAIQDIPQARQLAISDGSITFDNVQFQYKDAKVLFENKTVVVPPGQKVGLVGYSGSGKSTFVNLILRLFDISHGRILIDGQDIKQVTQDSLRQKIGMIPQDPSLFHRTLMDNIRYGRIEATEKEVQEAAQRAHAHEFIIELPKGYDSLVGERGIKLSGGQRQRIAIARAFLKNAPILILDEATSQLDSVTEQYIQESLWELMQGKTTIVIAHRLSTLLQMDRILVFEKGKIVEDGTHHDLLAKEGLYASLWKAQVGGFIFDNPDVV